MKLKIISDGTREGTYIIPMGEGDLEDVLGITWSMMEGDALATVTLTLGDVQVEVTGQTNTPTVVTCPHCNHRIETTVKNVGRYEEYKGTNTRWKCGRCGKRGFAEDWFFTDDMN